MMGVTVPLDEPFIMPDGSEMMQPLDGGGPARQVINCRCTFVAVLEGFDFEDILKDPREIEFDNNYENHGNRGIINSMEDSIRNPIELGHPADVAFRGKDLNKRQLELLDKLPGYGSQVTVRKRDVSMLDLSAMIAKTGDEFAMFTQMGTRLIIRGDIDSIPLSERALQKISANGYRWSGHAHPGYDD